MKRLKLRLFLAGLLIASFVLGLVSAVCCLTYVSHNALHLALCLLYVQFILLAVWFIWCSLLKVDNEEDEQILLLLSAYAICLVVIFCFGMIVGILVTSSILHVKLTWS